MGEIASFTIPTPPTDHPFRARAIVPLPVGIDMSTVWTPDADYPESLQRVQYRRVAKTATWDIMEICTVVPAGTTTVRLRDDYVEPDVYAAPILPPGWNGYYWTEILQMLRTQDAVRIEIQGHNGLAEGFSLTGAPGTPLRNGRYMITHLFHHQTERFGGFHWYWEVNAWEKTTRLVINWHNGVPQPHVTFRSVQLRVPNGMRWKRTIDKDLIMDGALQTLVKVGNHILPQRWERPFRVEVGRDEDIPEPPRYDRGLGFVEWKNYAAFGPQETKFPDMSHVPGLYANVTAAYEDANNRLGNLQNYADNSNPPISRFLPSVGSRYGGQSGGLQIDMDYGVRTACSKNPLGIQLAQIEQLRTRVRGIGAIYCDVPVPGGPYTNVGNPVTPELNINPDGTRGWSMQTFAQFQNQQGVMRDAPWRFQDFPPPSDPTDYNPYPLLAWQGQSLASNASDFGWDRYDNQHWIRGMRHNTALIWLDGDILAQIYATVDAELLRMIAWMDQNTPISPIVADKGWAIGRGHLWGLTQVAVSGAVNGFGLRHNRLRSYARLLVDAMAVCQIPESGCIRALNVAQGGKAVQDPPYNSNYLVCQTFEDTYMVHTLAACRGVWGETQLIPSGAAASISAMLAEVGRYWRDLCWITENDGQTVNGTAMWKRVPVGNIVGPVRYANRAAFPPLDIAVGAPTPVVDAAHPIPTVRAGETGFIPTFSSGRTYAPKFQFIKEGTLVVKSADGLTTYTLGVDYTLGGTLEHSNTVRSSTTIRATATGALAAGLDVVIDYHHMPCVFGILEGTMVVKDNTATVTYTEGVDYQLREQGGSLPGPVMRFATIVRIPTGAIGDGDTIKLTYEATNDDQNNGKFYDNVNEGYYMGSNLAIIHESGYDVLVDAQRHTVATGWPAIKAVLEGWLLTASQQSAAGAPIENWSRLLRLAQDLG